jgi:hypothetical protein
VKGVVDLFDKRNELPDISIVQAAPWIVFLELLDQPMGVVDADAQVVAHAAQEGPCEVAQFTRSRASEPRKLPAAMPDQSGSPPG